MATMTHTFISWSWPRSKNSPLPPRTRSRNAAAGDRGRMSRGTLRRLSYYIDQSRPLHRTDLGAQEQHRGLFVGGSEDLQFGQRVQVEDLAHLSSDRDDGANLVVAQGRDENPAYSGADGFRCADVNCQLDRRRKYIEGKDAEAMERALEPLHNALGPVDLSAASAPDFDVDDFDSERPGIGGQAAGLVRRFRDEGGADIGRQLFGPFKLFDEGVDTPGAAAMKVDDRVTVRNQR